MLRVSLRHRFHSGKPSEVNNVTLQKDSISNKNQTNYENGDVRITYEQYQIL